MTWATAGKVEGTQATGMDCRVIGLSADNSYVQRLGWIKNLLCVLAEVANYGWKLV